MHIVEYVAFAVGLIGAVVIIWGCLVATVIFLCNEWRRFVGHNHIRESGKLRHTLGTYLLLGLEFMVAADIIHTIAKPNIDGLIILGAIVTIRTVISYFLNLEIKEAHAEDQ